MDDDVYKMRQDPSVTVTFPLVGAKAEALGLTGVRALAWTTTPWTLPTNLALAVGPGIRYAVVPGGPSGAADVPRRRATTRRGRRRTATCSPRICSPATRRTSATRAPQAAQAAVESACSAPTSRTSTTTASSTTTRMPRPGAPQHAWRILVDDYVTTSDGTGIVHQAPAFGEDDQRVTEAAGIPLIMSLDDGGRFLPQVTDVAGELWMDANTPLVRLLRQAGASCASRATSTRTRTAGAAATPSSTRRSRAGSCASPTSRTALIANNEQITWVPENVKHGQFGKWLEGARDWSISRNRYWGSPIPVWKSDDPDYPRVDAYGSLEDIERDFGRLPRNAAGEVDLHRPYIDELTRPNPDDPTGASTMRRIEDVLDVWFDSGVDAATRRCTTRSRTRSGSTSTRPADFIVEYIGQTRGWFYVMHVLSTALFDRPAFTGVSCHGIVLGSDGQKMSKSLRNYPDVSEVFDRDGSDAMRWFLMSSSVLRGGNLVVTEEGIRAGVREFLLPLWNAWYFFATYANAASAARDGAGYEASWRTDSTDVLDRYILALTGDLVREVAADLEGLDSTMAAAKLRDFAEALTNWYIRRSRDRFWVGVDDADPQSREAFDTLYTVLETLTRVAAPLIPLVSERVWQGLTGGRSVHLAGLAGRRRVPCGRRHPLGDGRRPRGLERRERAAQARGQARAPAACRA